LSWGRRWNHAEKSFSSSRRAMHSKFATRKSKEQRWR
jgi:hypothetical protein